MVWGPTFINSEGSDFYSISIVFLIAWHSSCFKLECDTVPALNFTNPKSYGIVIMSIDSDDIVIYYH